MVNEHDIMGYVGPILVWCENHWSAMGAALLFFLQLAIQLIRLRKEVRDK